MPTVRAKEPFSYDADGYSHNVSAGDLFDAEDPCVKKRSHLFEPVEAAVARATRAVETASAEPGVLRTRSKRGHKSEPPDQPTEPDKDEE